MKILKVDCDADIAGWLSAQHPTLQQGSAESDLPISGYSDRVDIVLVGPSCSQPESLAKAISNWPSAPPTVFLVQASDLAELHDRMRYTPGVGRNIIVCEFEESAFLEGIESALDICNKRKELGIRSSDKQAAINSNVSPSWLLQLLLRDIPEYIYFKDTAGRFLAVSDYTAHRCGLENSNDAIGLTDFDLFDPEHAAEASADEDDLVLGKVDRVEKEEYVTWKGNKAWVHSVKLPMKSRSGYPLGTFGISRDITAKKLMSVQLERQHTQLEDELKLARTLQRSLLTKGIPQFKNDVGDELLNFSAKHISSTQLSGDFYSVLRTSSGNAAIFMADVMGHGAQAAMVTAMLYAAVNEISHFADEPSRFMLEINNMLYALLAEKGHMIFATGILCHIDFENENCLICQNGSGHLISSSDQHQTIPINPALGLLPQETFETKQIDYVSGDELLFFTDGISEAQNEEGEEFGVERLRKVLEDPVPEEASRVDSVIAALQAFTGRESEDDDICILSTRVF